MKHQRIEIEDFQSLDYIPDEDFQSRDYLAETVIHWIVKPSFGRVQSRSTTALRFIAAVHCLMPNMLPLPTMAKVARSQRITKQAFQKTCSQFRDLVGLDYIRTDKEREAMKQAARRAHKAKSNLQTPE